MVQELINALDRPTIRNKCKIEIIGDKFHMYDDYPNYGRDLEKKLLNSEGVLWLKRLSRDNLRKHLKNVQIAWCFRDPDMESKTHELSTKVIENCALGVPPILYPNNVNISFLGKDYPYFAKTLEEAYDLIETVCADYHSGAVAKIKEHIHTRALKFSHKTIGTSLYRDIFLNETESK